MRAFCTCDLFHCSLPLSRSSTDGKVCDKDCFPSSPRDEKTVAISDGLWSSQFPPLCSNADETKLHFLPKRPIIRYRRMPMTVPRLLLWYREINDTIAFLMDRWMDGWIDRFLPLLPPHCLSLAVSPILKGCVEVRSVDLTASRREKEKAGWGEGEGGTRVHSTQLINKPLPSFSHTHTQLTSVPPTLSPALHALLLYVVQPSCCWNAYSSWFLKGKPLTWTQHHGRVFAW